MAEGPCTPYGEPEDTLSTEYSIYGAFDVDALLAKARPRGKILVWRRGETTEFGPAASSGVTVPVFDGTSQAMLFRAVRRFLTRERSFLLAASRVRGSVHRGLLTSFFVRAENLPVGLELPGTLLELTGRSRVSWAVMGVPCAADGSIAVGGAPSNNEMQRTGPAQALEPRR